MMRPYGRRGHEYRPDRTSMLADNDDWQRLVDRLAEPPAPRLRWWEWLAPAVAIAILAGWHWIAWARLDVAFASAALSGAAAGLLFTTFLKRWSETRRTSRSRP